VSKKFKGKLCVYCAERPSGSGDHVFAREFFLPKDRHNLPKVPACSECNEAKSELEHYLTSVLPFGGRHEGAKANLETMVPPRVKKNRKLRRRLANGIATVWSEEGEQLLVPTMTLPIEPDRFEALFALIARGLIWHHWGTYLTREHSVRAILLTTSGERLFDRYLFGMKAHDRVSANLGNGTFVYEGAQGIDCPQLSVWCFSAFGGAKLGGDPKAPDETSSRIDVLTAPTHVFRNPELKGLFGVGT
jgi:hypothetical protein